MDFREFLKVILKRKWIIISVSVIAAVGTFLLLRTGKNEYKSKAIVSTGFTDVHEDKSENASNVIANKFSNLEEFMTSPTVFSLLSYKLFLRDVGNEPFRSLEPLYEKNVTKEEIEIAARIYAQKLDSGLVLSAADEKEKRLLNILEWMGYGNSLEEVIKVGRVASTDFIEISSTSENKFLSAFMVNTLAEEGIKSYNANLRKNLSNTLSFYKDLTDKKKAELDFYLDSLNRLKTTYQVVDYNTESQNKLQRLSNLEIAKEQEKQRISSLSQSLASINRSLASAGQLDKNEISRNISSLKNRIHGMNERFINSGSSNKQLADSIHQLREELKDLTNLYQQNSTVEATAYDELKKQKIHNQIELDVARSNLYAIQKSIDSVQSEVGTFASKETSLSALETTIQVLKGEYLELLNKYHKTKNAVMDVSRLHILEKGQPALKAEPKKASVFAAVAGIVTFGFAVVLLFILYYFDNSIKNAVRFTEISGLPLLGVLNRIKFKSLNVDEIFSEDQKIDSEKSLFLTQVRQIRYKLEQGKNKVFLFTSNVEEEGKTITVISLAYSIALIKKRVLVIDTNFKNNSITKIFSAKSGIINYIYADKKVNKEEPVYEEYENYSEGATSSGFKEENKDSTSGQPGESKWLQHVKHTGLAGVDVIGCERSNLSASEVFAGKPFDKFLDEIRNHYDYILLEGPSLLNYSDSKELSVFADKVINVLSAERTLSESDFITFDFLESLGDKFMGCVLNKVKSDDV